LLPRGDPRAADWLAASHYQPSRLRLVNFHSRRLEHHFIDVAPDPVLTRLERLNDWMVGCVEVLGGMLVLGRITAAHVSTGETETQVYPAISGFQAVLTAIGAWRDLAYLIEMRTAVSHVVFLPTTCVSDSLIHVCLTRSNSYTSSVRCRLYLFWVASLCSGTYASCELHLYWYTGLAAWPFGSLLPLLGLAVASMVDKDVASMEHKDTVARYVVFW
jgi:hypothetical protein